MRIGIIITADPEHNPKLPGEWIEVFPDGTMADLTITTNIPRDKKRASGRHAFKGASPLLVELAWWNAHGPKEAGK